MPTKCILSVLCILCRVSQFWIQTAHRKNDQQLIEFVCPGAAPRCQRFSINTQTSKFSRSVFRCVCVFEVCPRSVSLPGRLASGQCQGSRSLRKQKIVPKIVTKMPQNGQNRILKVVFDSCGWFWVVVDDFRSFHVVVIKPRNRIKRIKRNVVIAFQFLPQDAHSVVIYC